MDKRCYRTEQAYFPDWTSAVSGLEQAVLPDMNKRCFRTWKNAVSGIEELFPDWTSVVSGLENAVFGLEKRGFRINKTKSNYKFVQSR